MARTPNRALTIAYNRRGQPWLERQLNQALDRLIDSLAEAGKVRPNLTLHGLRHSRGVELALAGASDSEIMSQLEHADSRTAQIYRRQAERRQLADSGQAKINESIRRRVARKAAEAASDNTAGEAVGTAWERNCKSDCKMTVNSGNVLKPDSAKSLNLSARPERFERPTLRFVE